MNSFHAGVLCTLGVEIFLLGVYLIIAIISGAFDK